MGIVVVKVLLFAFGCDCVPVEISTRIGKHLDANKREFRRTNTRYLIRSISLQCIFHISDIIVIGQHF